MNNTTIFKAVSVDDRVLGYTLLCHPQVPKPLHVVNPRTIWGNAWWNMAREKAYARANYKCEACGVEKAKAKFHPWLEAHEVYDIDYKNGRATYKYLVALCHACHNYIHQGRARMTKSAHDYDMIMSHGDFILQGKRLPPKPDCSEFAEWEDWRMVLNGVEYKPKFEDYSEWCRHYGKEDRSGTASESYSIWDAIEDIESDFYE